MSGNGRILTRHPRIELQGTSASPAEVAAVVAAIEQFLRDTAPPPLPPEPLAGWLRAGLFEGAGVATDAPSPWLSPWGDPEPWGSALGKQR